MGMSAHTDDVGTQPEWWYSNSAFWFVGVCVGDDFETTTKLCFKNMRLVAEEKSKVN